MIQYLGTFIYWLANILYFALLARALLSWLNLPTKNPIISVLYQITEPILAPIRRVLPRVGMMDFSPMVAMVLIFMVQRFLVPRLLG